MENGSEGGPVTLTRRGFSEPGGCGDAEIDAAEERPGVAFPAEFRAMMRDFAGAETKELDCVFHPERLVPATQTDIPYFGCIEDCEAIPPADLAKVVAFCQSYAGNYYALDFRVPGRVGVLDFDHESGEIPSWDSFDAFIADAAEWGDDDDDEG